MESETMKQAEAAAMEAASEAQESGASTEQIQTAAVEAAEQVVEEKQIMTEKQKAKAVLQTEVEKKVAKWNEPWTIRTMFQAINQPEAKVRNVVMAMVKAGTVVAQTADKKRYQTFMKAAQ